MSKRIIALLLCAFMLVPLFVGCAKDEEKDDDPGAYITMYLTDDTFNFDPAAAYYNKNTINIVGMMFDTLFKLNANGKVEKSLVKKYTPFEDKEKDVYYMDIYLNTTCWSNKVQITSEDVVFAWKRLLNANNDYAAAALLYDIKNARAVKEGDESIDDLGIEAVQMDMVRVTFEGPIDYDQFLLNLTSVATAPLSENYVTKNEDWAKKPSSMVTSGAYKLGKVNYIEVDGQLHYDDNAKDQYGEVVGKGTYYNAKDINYFILERNNYYYRDAERDPIDETVKNYRIIVDCSKTDEDILADYQNGRLFYIGNIPLSLRSDSYVLDNAQVSNALSTFVCYMNETRLFDDDGNEETPGVALFANEKVRQALSLAIDREAIAKAVVFAEAATGLVCPGVFNAGAGKKAEEFRTVGGSILATTANMSEAKSLLSSAGIDPSKFTFTLKAAGYDDVNMKISEMIVAAWTELGFNVTLEKTSTIINNDVLKELVGTQGEVPSDICDDLFVESIQRGNFDVIAFDYNALSADAYSMLAGFAHSFAGMSVDMTSENYEIDPHVTGYASEEYNTLMEAVYYVPYFASFTQEELADEEFTFLSIYDTHEEFMSVYNAVKAVYDANGITPTTDKKQWTAQKAVLLHAAEKMLLEDMPVIPVLFNKNAVMIHEDLSDVTTTYYLPAYFRETTLKDYEKYTPVLVEFPTVDWDKFGMVETESESESET